MRVPREGLVYLMVDRASDGYERRPVGSYPKAIDLANLPVDGLHIEVIRALPLQVGVQVDIGGERVSALNTSLAQEDRAGVRDTGSVVAQGRGST